VAVGFQAVASASEARKGAVAESRSEAPDFTLGAGDLLSVFIYGEDGAEDCLVRPDGRISLRLIGDVQAAGHTPEELAKAIVEKLRPIQVDARVTVVVREIHSYRLYILGQVGQPSEIVSVQPLRLLQALAVAGGPAEFARGKVTLIREQRRIEIDYEDIIEGKNPDGNIWLLSGDVVIVK